VRFAQVFFKQNQSLLFFNWENRVGAIIYQKERERKKTEKPQIEKLLYFGSWSYQAQTVKNR
jgi:hypothetical protein